MLDQWSNFFVMVGSGAALAGLIFVAMSINPGIIIGKFFVHRPEREAAVMSKEQMIGRRGLIAASGMGLFMLQTCFRAQAQQSPAKLSKSDAAYQEAPKNNQQCSECTKFQPPKGCSVVSGDISPKGWCKLYEAPPE